MDFGTTIKALALAVALPGLGMVLGDNIYIEQQNNEQQEARDTTQARDTVRAQGPGATAQPQDDEGAYGEEQDRIGEIEAADTAEILTRKRSKNFSIAGFGPATFDNIGEGGISYNFYAGRVWEVNPFAAIKSTGEVISDFTDAVLVDLNLGANYYPFNADISPYVGGTLGFGYGNGADLDNDFGFNLGASVGAQLFRTSSTQMNLEGKTSILLADVDDGAPMAYSARIGVLF